MRRGCRRALRRNGGRAPRATVDCRPSAPITMRARAVSRRPSAWRRMPPTTRRRPSVRRSARLPCQWLSAPAFRAESEAQLRAAVDEGGAADERGVGRGHPTEKPPVRGGDHRRGGRERSGRARRDPATHRGPRGRGGSRPPPCSGRALGPAARAWVPAARPHGMGRGRRRRAPGRRACPDSARRSRRPSQTEPRGPPAPGSP